MGLLRGDKPEITNQNVPGPYIQDLVRGCGVEITANFARPDGRRLTLRYDEADDEFPGCHEAYRLIASMHRSYALSETDWELGESPIPGPAYRLDAEPVPPNMVHRITSHDSSRSEFTAHATFPERDLEQYPREAHGTTIIPRSLLEDGGDLTLNGILGCSTDDILQDIEPSYRESPEL